MAKEASSTSLQNVLPTSGPQKVKSSEVVREKKQTSVNISVVLLDHSEVVFNVNKRDRGQVLLDLVFQNLHVKEIKFFGLQFPNDVPDTMRWLDPTKSIRKQFRRGYPNIIFFRIKFYASDISSMKDEFTRYQLFLQIKLDLLEKRLHCHSSTAAMLASLAVQAELGDYNQLEHKNNYVSGFKFVPNQTKEFEIEVQRLHKMHKGVSRSQAAYNVIRRAQKLEMYGVEVHHAKDNEENDLDVGVTSTGMILYQKGLKKNQFKWSAIVKISFKRRQFYVQLRGSANPDVNPNDLIYSFHMDNYRSCKKLWKSCVDFHSFYRLDKYVNNSYIHKHAAKEISASQPIESKSDKNLFGFFTLSSKSKLKEPDVGSNDNTIQHQQYLRSRASSAKLKENFVSSFADDRSLADEKAPRRLSAPPSVSYGIGDSVLTDDEMHALLLNSSVQQSDNNRHMRNAVDLKALSKTESNASFEVLPSPAKYHIEMHSPDPALVSTFHQLHVGAKAVTEIDSTVSSDASLLTGHGSANSVLSSIPDKSYLLSEGVALPFPHQASGNPVNGVPEGMVLIRIKPDQEGRYGFNVKGGADQNMPVTVSKVASNSPASKCNPSLHEGDHVLQINGRDISGHSHEQVVRFIRSTRENHSSQLVLLVSPANFKTDLEQPESFLQPMPVANAVNRLSMLDEGALLHKSMQWLEELLDSGELLVMFDSLYRKKPGSTMNDARLPINVSKNRYRDISPYDNTRIRLQFGTSDYINANYVNMFIPGIEWTNLYAASQGPLMSTTVDFWTMVWELKANLIVMLTTVIERGRPKCHQYWPDDGVTVQYGPWIIESVSEEVTSAFAYRDFLLYQCIDEETKSEPRLIRQMQYIAWPDHGVPDDSSDFLEFVLQIRQYRVGMSVPCVVHCSAGIGRTGVLITMETAMCLVEANQPVYPIEITRTMRDQRAMMIQTPGQFKFVCEAILRVYKEGLAKPMLDEDQDISEPEETNDSSCEASMSSKTK